MTTLLSNPVLDPSRAFLDFVAREPGCLSRDSFGVLEAPGQIAQYPLQSWPAFVSEAELAEQRRVSMGLFELVKALPGRLFGNDAEALAEAFDLEGQHAELLVSLLGLPGYLDGVVGRGDYFDTANGLQCLELNMSSNLGGWQNVGWAELYRKVPVLRGFFEEPRFECSCIDTLGALFEHLVTCHRQRAREQGEDPSHLRVAFLTPPENTGRKGWFEVAGAAFERHLLLFHPNIRGGLFGGTYEDLEEHDGELRLGGERLHVAVEAYQGRLDRKLFAALLSGRAVVLNGPADQILSNKRCLALLSEHAEQYFEAEEARLVADHVPFTRSLGEVYTHYRGERVYLPELVVEERERFVLKPALGMRGEGVSVGALVDEDTWEERVEEALEEQEGGGWLVQERVQPRPMEFQAGERGSCPHDVVWGFFVFGQQFGGSFLRMLPSDDHAAVINAAQGATESPVFVVRERTAP